MDQVDLTKTERHSDMKEGLSLFGLPAGQELQRAGRLLLPALPYSRPAALESLLSVALSSAGQIDCIAIFLEQVGSNSLLKWAHFRCQF
jgi:hypothetical protein